jgi:hypothetical protein
MINRNRRDGGARAVNEVAGRLAENHEVNFFAGRAGTPYFRGRAREKGDYDGIILSRGCIDGI